ncbi:MAG: 1-acyl-sn-glycerol-3-phosphate acyltransferase [Clostridiales bacterium]|nr:1-acyl-sn-glycerol-3-phosphate acyltransferase [Clostridiales bacterium]
MTGFDRFIRRVTVWVCGVLSKSRFDSRVTVSEVPPQGSLIVCNHTSVWDFAHLLRALAPRYDERFLATGVQFDMSRLRKWLFPHGGIIRKNQGATDVKCVRELMNAVKEGGTPVVYAQGMTSFDGRPGWRALSGTGALAKLLRCDVYACVIHGGFMSRPRYVAPAKGRVDIELRKVFSKDETLQLKTDELQKGIDSAIDFNDWDWQEREKVPFKRIRLVKNLTRVLYKCPACLREGELRESRYEITCPACGFSCRRDDFGFFYGSDACPRRMDEWTDMEIASAREEISRQDFMLKEEMACASFVESGKAKPQQLGSGTLVLTRGGLEFRGEGGSVSISTEEFIFMLLDDGRAVMINTQAGFYRFDFKDPSMMVKWFFCHRLIKTEEGK